MSVYDEYNCLVKINLSCHIIWRNSFRFHTNIFWSRWSRLHHTGTLVYWLFSNYRGIKFTKRRSRSFTNFPSCYGILRINIKIAGTGGIYTSSHRELQHTIPEKATSLDVEGMYSNHGMNNSFNRYTSIIFKIYLCWLRSTAVAVIATKKQTISKIAIVFLIWLFIQLHSKIFTLSIPLWCEKSLQ